MKGLDLMKSNMTPMYSKFGEKLIQDIMFGKPKTEIDQQIIDGRRITDAETLKVVTMVYAGYINKNILITYFFNK